MSQQFVPIGESRFHAIPVMPHDTTDARHVVGVLDSLRPKQVLIDCGPHEWQHVDDGSGGLNPADDLLLDCLSPFKNIRPHAVAREATKWCMDHGVPLGLALPREPKMRKKTARALAKEYHSKRPQGNAPRPRTRWFYTEVVQQVPEASQWATDRYRATADALQHAMAPRRERGALLVSYPFAEAILNRARQVG